MVSLQYEYGCDLRAPGLTEIYDYNNHIHMASLQYECEYGFLAVVLRDIDNYNVDI